MAISEMNDDEDYGEVQDILELSHEGVEEEIEEEEPKEELEAELDGEKELDFDDDEIVVVEDEEEKPKAKADEDDDLDDYGAKVKKRVGKAIYERNIARERAEAAEARAAELEAKLAESSAGQAEKDRADAIAAANAELDEMAQELEDAMSDEDAAAVSAVLGKQSRKYAEIVALESAPKAAPRETVDDLGAGNNQPKKLDASAQSWMDNNPWFDDPAHESATKMAEDIEDILRKEEGFDLGPDLYKELDKRMDAAYPKIAKMRKTEIEDDDGLDDEPKPKPKPRSVVSGQDSGDAVVPAKPRANTITQSDLKAMEKYGFDKNSPSDRKAWLNRNAEL